MIFVHHSGGDTRADQQRTEFFSHQDVRCGSLGQRFIGVGMDRTSCISELLNVDLTWMHGPRERLNQR